MNAPAAADLLWTLWSEQRTIDSLPPALRPATLDDSWEVQRELDRRAGARVGWKIAATSPAGQRQIGADGPQLGRLYDRTVVEPGAALPAGPLTMKSAEAEFAFVMAGAPTAADRASVLEAIGALHPAIEVPDSRFDDFTAVGLPSLVADAMCIAHVVVGPPAPAWTPEELPSHPVRMLRNDEVAARGSGANVLGDPIEALVWLAGVLDARGEALDEGDLVITGACTPPNPVAPGDFLVADFGALGRVDVQFT